MGYSCGECEVRKGKHTWPLVSPSTFFLPDHFRMKGICIMGALENNSILRNSTHTIKLTLLMYNSVVFSIFIELCSHHNYSNARPFYPLRRKTLWAVVLHSLLQLLETTNPLSVCMDLPILEISYKQTPRKCAFYDNGVPFKSNFSLWLQRQNKYIEEYLEGTRNETTVFCFLDLEIITLNVLGVF